MAKGSLPKYTWLKVKIDMIYDPDFMALSANAVDLYFKMYLLAGKAAAGGLLCNESKVFEAKDIAWALHLSLDEFEARIPELIKAGWVQKDENGFVIAHFLEEQGPGDDEQRARWREQQRNHRVRVKRMKESEIKREETLEEDIESQPDVSLTSSPSGASFSERMELGNGYPALEGWYEVTGTRLPTQFRETWIQVVEENPEAGLVTERLADCWNFWLKLAAEKEWSINNPPAVFDLYPIPQLEDRMEREGWSYPDNRKERERLQRLVDAGWLDADRVVWPPMISLSPEIAARLDIGFEDVIDEEHAMIGTD